MIQINNLSKEFGSILALDHISLSLPKGEIIGLAGPDGAGKTTLIRLMATLLLPTTGSIRIGQLDTVRDAAQIHEQIGYMPQKFGLYEDLTVLENLNLYADLNNVVGKEKEEKFKMLLSFTGLAPFTDRLSGRLSGGMKQKLGLACTLIKTPELLLLDEPSVGVDPISRRELWKMVQELAHSGMTIIWSTSNLEEAERCKLAILLNNGKVLFSGNPKDLTAKMEGKVYKIKKSPDKLRSALVAFMQKPDVVDATIQASEIRIVMREPSPPARIKATPDKARFEDAFIDLLGGVPKTVSTLQASTVQGKKAIHASHLTKKFGSFTAVDNVTFEIAPGEIFGLLGPNGAGKTTTFKMLCGLIKPTSGEATIAGISFQKAPSVARSHIGYMAQKFSLYDGLSVIQNLQFFSGVYNLTGKAKQDRIAEMSEIFHLEPYLEMTTSDLPLGYKQRLSLACAVMHRPAILFLDEPTSGVDPLTRREFWNHIDHLVMQGTTIIVTTHFMEEAEYCDRIALIFQGKMLTLGTPAELKKGAQTPEQPHPTMEDAFIYWIEGKREPIKQ